MYVILCKKLATSVCVRQNKLVLYYRFSHKLHRVIFFISCAAPMKYLFFDIIIRSFSPRFVTLVETGPDDEVIAAATVHSKEKKGGDDVVNSRSTRRTPRRSAASNAARRSTTRAASSNAARHPPAVDAPSTSSRSLRSDDRTSKVVRRSPRFPVVSQSQDDSILPLDPLPSLDESDNDDDVDDRDKDYKEGDDAARLSDENLEEDVKGDDDENRAEGDGAEGGKTDDTSKRSGKSDDGDGVVDVRNDGGNHDCGSDVDVNVGEGGSWGSDGEKRSVEDLNDEDESGDDDDEEKMVKKMCLPVSVFVPLLQGEGVRDKKTKQHIMRYPQLRKLAGKFYRHWKSLNVIGLPQNSSRTADRITGLLIRLRRHADVYQLEESLWKYADKDDEKMYVLFNDHLCGQTILTRQVLTVWCSNILKVTENRTPSLAVRAIHAFCEPRHREGMVHYLSGKWYRGDFDQCIPTERAFAEDVLLTFKDPWLQCFRPEYMNSESHDPERRIDPFNCDYKDRDAVWLLETWKKYIRPKYKKSLGKWYKETGGGNRKSENFVNYCGADRWIAAVYAIDETTDFLLASGANGRPPSFMVQEAGFEHDDFPGEKESEEERKIPAIKKRKEKLEVMMEESSKTLADLVDTIKKRVEDTNEFSEMDAISKINTEKRKIDTDSDFSPDTKKKLHKALARKKIYYARKLIQKDEDENDDDDK